MRPCHYGHKQSYRKHQTQTEKHKKKSHGLDDTRGSIGVIGGGRVGIEGGTNGVIVGIVVGVEVAIDGVAALLEARLASNLNCYPSQCESSYCDHCSR
ncbi:hypothetical protein F0562_005963 [Nyssa sinensis]|uniref:Uncharacterized protein n=1 Tax=Nyssa sinensis TaxID=561372 RepID=A0A5J5ALW3_9ASTE|nr:hypothetical protein F0562_005963 [Nyssa sinensis]